MTDRDADYNLRLLEPLARALRQKGGDTLLESVLAGCTVQPTEFRSRLRWISHREFEHIVSAARAHWDSDDEFRSACAYKLAEGWGPLAMLFWGATPRLVYATSERMSSFMTNVGRFEVVSTTSTSAHIRYTSRRLESRLMCLSRQGQSARVPTLFGLPEAQTRELSCIAWGDAACEYEFRWVLRRRWLVPTLAAFATAPVPFLMHEPAGFLLPAFAALAGYVLDARNVDRANLRAMEGTAEALRHTIADEATVRRELLALQERQATWQRIVESTRAEQQSALEHLALQLQGIQEERNAALLGLGHDLRNPLAVISSNLEMLAEEPLTTHQHEVIEEMRGAAERMASMLADLMVVVRTSGKRLHLKPEAVSTAPLVEQIRRRATALAFGKDVRVTVFSNRECPDSVWIDPIVLDRIIDNLLTNAAKYTQRGSIIVELDGVPDFFVLKVGDTGRGIASNVIEKVFEPRVAGPQQRSPDSYGVGLAAVVNLLRQIGGRLEVMSKPDVGSTFWVYLPLREPTIAADGSPAVGNENGNADMRLSDVVRIRRVPA
jgi:signal transduction histidine kinase